VAIEAPAETFVAQLESFRDIGGVGANVTLPLKSQAFEACAKATDYAARTGVVNTLEALPGHGWRGHNTDGPGLVADLTERQRVDLRGRDVLLLGAGARSLTIANRTPNRADALADRIGMPGRVHVRYWADLAASGSYNLVINATAAGVMGGGFDLPFSIVAPRSLCYDLSYGKNATAFLAWAQAAGSAQNLDGLGMLVEQAALAFEIWFGHAPDTDPVYAALRAQLST